MPYCPVCQKCLCRVVKGPDRKPGANPLRCKGNFGKLEGQFQNDSKYGGGIISSKCGHLFHQNCLCQYVETYKRKGDSYGTTYNVLCPVCGQNLCSGKMLKIDIEAHFGILEEFFQDIYKLKYMNKELKRTLEQEWSDIADLEKKIEATKEEYETLKVSKFTTENNIAAQEGRILKALDDANTCLRYKEIEKQLLEENVNLEAVARRLETIIIAQSHQREPSLTSFSPESGADSECECCESDPDCPSSTARHGAISCDSAESMQEQYTPQCVQARRQVDISVQISVHSECSVESMGALTSGTKTKMVRRCSEEFVQTKSIVASAADSEVDLRRLHDHIFAGRCKSDARIAGHQQPIFQCPQNFPVIEHWAKKEVHKLVKDTGVITSQEKFADVKALGIYKAPGNTESLERNYASVTHELSTSTEHLTGLNDLIQKSASRSETDCCDIYIVDSGNCIPHSQELTSENVVETDEPQTYETIAITQLVQHGTETSDSSKQKPEQTNTKVETVHEAPSPVIEKSRSYTIRSYNTAAITNKSPQSSPLKKSPTTTKITSNRSHEPQSRIIDRPNSGTPELTKQRSYTVKFHGTENTPAQATTDVPFSKEDHDQIVVDRTLDFQTESKQNLSATVAKLPQAPHQQENNFSPVKLGVVESRGETTDKVPHQFPCVVGPQLDQVVVKLHEPNTDYSQELYPHRHKPLSIEPSANKIVSTDSKNAAIVTKLNKSEPRCATPQIPPKIKENPDHPKRPRVSTNKLRRLPPLPPHKPSSSSETKPSHSLKNTESKTVIPPNPNEETELGIFCDISQLPPPLTPATACDFDALVIPPPPTSAPRPSNHFTFVQPVPPPPPMSPTFHLPCHREKPGSTRELMASILHELDQNPCQCRPVISRKVKKTDVRLHSSEPRFDLVAVVPPPAPTDVNGHDDALLMAVISRSAASIKTAQVPQSKFETGAAGDVLKISKMAPNEISLALAENLPAAQIMHQTPSTCLAVERFATELKQSQKSIVDSDSYGLHDPKLHYNVIREPQDIPGTPAPTSHSIPLYAHHHPFYDDNVPVTPVVVEGEFPQEIDPTSEVGPHFTTYKTLHETGAICSAQRWFPRNQALSSLLSEQSHHQNFYLNFQNSPPFS